MKQRFRLYRRNGGIYYLHDSETGKQTSLGTRDRAEATALFVARTQAHRQAHLNLQLARAYLAATDPMVAKRTWQVPMEELAKTKRGATYERWQYVVKDKAFDLIRKLANSGDPGGAFSSRVGGWDRFDQRVPAPHPQLCVGRGLAALAGHRKAPVAEHPLPGKARSHPRGTSGHH